MAYDHALDALKGWPSPPGWRTVGYDLATTPNCGKSPGPLETYANQWPGWNGTPAKPPKPVQPVVPLDKGGSGAPDARFECFPRALVNGVLVRDVVMLVDRGRVARLAFRTDDGRLVEFSGEVLTQFAIAMVREVEYPKTRVALAPPTLGKPYLTDPIPSITFKTTTLPTQSPVLEQASDAVEAGKLASLLEKIGVAAPSPPPDVPPDAPWRPNPRGCLGDDDGDA